MDDFDARIVRVPPPIYLMRATIPCWKCGDQTPVVGLAATTVEQDGEVYGSPKARPPQVVTLKNISDMPYDLLQVVRAHQRQYVKRESRTAGLTYYQNECHACDANIGDFYLFSEPGGPFFPMSREEAARVEVFDLPIVGTLELEADFGEGGADLIYAQRSTGA